MSIWREDGDRNRLNEVGKAKERAGSGLEKFGRKVGPVGYFALPFVEIVRNVQKLEEV